MTRGGRALGALIFLLSVTIGLLVAGTSAIAACPAPHLSVSPLSLAPGQLITITGTDFVCAPTTSGSEAPVVHFDLKFVQGSLSVNIAAVDTGGQFEIGAPIPSNARAGAAQIEASGNDLHVFATMRVSGVTTVAHTGVAPRNDLLFFAALFVIAGWLARAWANAPD